MTASNASALRGFTLLEVAAVMAITGIVLAMAVPSYANFAARQQLRAAGESLALDLRLAREESLRGASVFISYRAG
ncbi:Tfp pilus assembly protein FimT/FimU, partial [Roseateles sp.]|uniref:Tfp pilus assembly protein FimT/FimU n=1 Tax=Roseateles sp. TaxID=1971397 RepID=UPI0037CA8856